MAQNFDLFEKPLAQLRPTTTGIETLYELTGQEFAVAKQLEICSVVAGNVTFSVYYDIDGTTFDDTNCILKDQVIRGKETIALDNKWWPLREPNSGFGVEISSADAVVFTLTGFDAEIG